MKTKEIFQLVLVGVFSALVGWLASSFLVTDPGEFELRTAKELVYEIPNEFKDLPKEFFNAEKSLDTYDEVCTGEPGQPVTCPEIDSQ